MAGIPDPRRLAEVRQEKLEQGIVPKEGMGETNRHAVKQFLFEQHIALTGKKLPGNTGLSTLLKKIGELLEKEEKKVSKSQKTDKTRSERTEKPENPQKQEKQNASKSQKEDETKSSQEPKTEAPKK